MAVSLKERMATLKPKLLANIDKIFVGFIGVIFIILGYIYMQEQGVGTVEITPPEPKDINVRLTTKKDDPRSGKVGSVEFMFLRSAIEEKNSPFNILINRNMFDPKEVRDPAQLAQEAREAVGLGQTYFDQGNLEAAKAEVDKALQLDVNFAPALALKAKIEAAEKARQAPKDEAGAGGSGSG